MANANAILYGNGGSGLSRPPEDPKLLVMADYRMGFDVTPKGESSLLGVFIDYGLPATAPGSGLGRLLGGVYARWCTRRMAEDAIKHFSASTKSS